MKSKVLLIPLSLLYKAVITIRHRLFDWGVLHSEHFDIPIVCICLLYTSDAADE